MNIKEMPIEEVMKLDPHTLSIEDLKIMKERLSDEQFSKMRDKAQLETQKQMARQTKIEHSYKLPHAISVAWLADADQSQFIGMDRITEGITTPVRVRKHTKPDELVGKKYDMVILDFGGVGEHFGELVYIDYCKPVADLIEDNPNTLYLFRTTWTSMWMNNYFSDEVKSDTRVQDYPNVAYVENDFGESYKPLHTTNWGQKILDWFAAEHIETRVPAHPNLQHLLEK